MIGRCCLTSRNFYGLWAAQHLALNTSLASPRIWHLPFLLSFLPTLPLRPFRVLLLPFLPPTLPFNLQNGRKQRDEDYASDLGLHQKTHCRRRIIRLHEHSAAGTAIVAYLLN